MGLALVGDWDTRRGPVSISCRVRWRWGCKREYQSQLRVLDSESKRVESPDQGLSRPRAPCWHFSTVGHYQGAHLLHEKWWQSLEMWDNCGREMPNYYASTIESGDSWIDFKLHQSNFSQGDNCSPWRHVQSKWSISSGGSISESQSVQTFSCAGNPKLVEQGHRRSGECTLGQGQASFEVGQGEPSSAGHSWVLRFCWWRFHDLGEIANSLHH